MLGTLVVLGDGLLVQLDPAMPWERMVQHAVPWEEAGGLQLHAAPSALVGE